MLKFTFDTNCIIAIEQRRPEADALLKLIGAHRAGAADVGIVAISASERQQDNSYIHNFDEFTQRLALLGLHELTLLKPMAYLDVTFFDFCIFPSPDMENLEHEIHNVLFPSIEFYWPDYCSARGIKLNELKADRKWLNAKCDVQALWGHIANKRDVFVTSDKNFHAQMRKSALSNLGSGRIEYPATAAALF